MNSLYEIKSIAYIFKIHMARSSRLWNRTLDECTRAGLHECGEENVSATARDNTGQNTKSTHLVPV